MNEVQREELMERNLITLIEDEEQYTGASPILASIGAVTVVATMLGITSNCTSQCWHP